MLRILVPALFLLIPICRACDLCAVYSAIHAQGLSPTAWTVSTASQFTHFATLRLDGNEVADPAAQRLDSSITQLVLSHGLTPRFSAQVNLPFIRRSFRRPEGDTVVQGRTQGLGDLTLLGRVLLLQRDTARTTVRWDVIAGAKLPTGATSRLREEAEETEPEQQLLRGGAHPDVDEQAPSGVHGHDLTLGSGSVDAVFGTNVYARVDRMILAGFVQYALRTRGDFEYRFANDLAWEIAPGGYVWLGHQHTLAVQIVCSGERKGNDDLADHQAEDTGITSVYLGPRLTYTHGLQLGVTVGAEVPVMMRNTALQLTPDYRARANLTWTF